MPLCAHRLGSRASALAARHCLRPCTHALTGVSARSLLGTACSSVQWRKAPVLPVPSGGAHATSMQHTPCSVTTCSMLPIPCSTRRAADTVQHGWQRAASIGHWALPAAAKPRVTGAHATTRRWPAPGRTPRQARTRWRAHPRETGGARTRRVRAHRGAGDVSRWMLYSDAA